MLGWDAEKRGDIGGVWQRLSGETKQTVGKAMREKIRVDGVVVNR